MVTVKVNLQIVKTDDQYSEKIHAKKREKHYWKGSLNLTYRRCGHFTLKTYYGLHNKTDIKLLIKEVKVHIK